MKKNPDKQNRIVGIVVNFNKIQKKTKNSNSNKKNNNQNFINAIRGEKEEKNFFIFQI